MGGPLPGRFFWRFYKSFRRESAILHRAVRVFYSERALVLGKSFGPRSRFRLRPTFPKCLSSEKALHYAQGINSLLRRKRATKKQLQQVVGQLRHYAAAVFGGECFVRRLEIRANSLRASHHAIRITSDLQEDLKWWLARLASLAEGVPFSFYLRNPQDSQIIICSDASGTTGIGATSTTGLS